MISREEKEEGGKKREAEKVVVVLKEGRYRVTVQRYCAMFFSFHSGVFNWEGGSCWWWRRSAACCLVDSARRNKSGASLRRKATTLNAPNFLALTYLPQSLRSPVAGH